MKDISIFDYKLRPYIQAGIVLFLVFSFLVIYKIAFWLGWTEDEIFPWIVGVGMLLFYAIFNSLLSFAVTDDGKYWQESIIGFLGVLVLGAAMSWIVSGVSLNDAMSVKTIYFVFTIGYLVFVSIVSMVKKLVDVAKKHDTKN